MAEQASKEFGKRRPRPPAPPAPPPKRSSHVALLLTGTLAVGGTAYAVMPNETCTPPSPGMTAPAMPQANGATCSSRGSSGGGFSHSSRYSFFSGGYSFTRSSSASSSSESGSGSVTRGGFGAFARAFGFSGRS